MLFNKSEITVLEEFTRSKNARIYGSDISKKKKLNQKTVSNILNRLEKENILKFKTEGKNKYYFLNERGNNTRELVKLIEIAKKMEFMKRHPKLISVLNELENKTSGILILFGSYVKNTQNKTSDLDIFVIGEIENIRGVEDSFGVEINIIKTSKIKFDENQPLVKEVLSNHIIFKGMEDFVELIW